MDAFAVAARMGMELDPGQLAQLRAVNSRHYQRLLTLVHAQDTAAAPRGSDLPATARAPTGAERRELHALLVRDVRALVSPGQRGRLDRPAARVSGAEDPVLAWEWEGGRVG